MAKVRVITPAGHALLDIKQIVATMHIPEHAMASVTSAEVQSFMDHNTRELILKMIARLPGKQFDQKEHFYPRDWWQAFKARWLTSTLSKRVFGGVQYTRIVMTAEATYPSIRVPNHNPFVQVTMKQT